MYSHKLCKAVRRPLVQQGLVAKDPDVDAIYRLINADRIDGLNVQFDRHAPPIFLKPGYFAQRLLHLVGGTIGFYPANAIQRRNPHNYLADFKEEEKLYSDSEQLIELLAKWNCSSTTVETCLIELTQLLAQHQFWGTEEVSLAEVR
ncbi:unnamed protein product [Gongylonema pulchrum]|uniref:Mor domain-containing protein n=1 Tax=Gongylonema pulchrum TaxID=637853 RepID=A0A183ECM3_9BILA|nr:unnamed protein product [Gongylonema pulchrum]